MKVTRATLQRDRITMMRYLELRLRKNDMHGVQDAASDIREIDAQLQVMTK